MSSKSIPTGAEARENDVVVLWTAVRTGRPGAWDALFERYAGLVHSIARSFRFQDADVADVVQNTWLRLIEHADSIREPRALGSWLATTTRRECLAQYRRGHRAIPIEELVLAEIPADSPGPETVALLEIDRQAVRAVVNDLPPARRNLIHALFVTESSYQDIAGSFGIPVGSIGPTRARCMASIRAQLESGEFELAS